VKFADDFILGCEVEKDASRIMQALQNCFAKYGLTIHPDKSKMVHFRWPSRFEKKNKTGTFDFLWGVLCKWDSYHDCLNR